MEHQSKCYDNYKVAWMAGGQLHSSMHSTLEEARKAELTVPQPRMIMHLTSTTGTGQYAWELLPGPWANAVKYWEWAVLILGLILIILVFKLRK
jgi:hypothetical protein